MSEPIRVPAHDQATLKLCIASAWLHETISGGRARELVYMLGWDFAEIEDLRAAEERADEALRTVKVIPLEGTTR